MDLTDQQGTIIEPLCDETRRPDGCGCLWRDARAVSVRRVIYGSLLGGGYDRDGVIAHRDVRRIEPVMPPRAHRQTSCECDVARSCERNLIERFFNIIMHVRAIATATKRPPETSSQAPISSAPWLGSNDDRP